MAFEELCSAVEAGDQDKSKSVAQKLVEGGSDPLQMIEALTFEAFCSVITCSSAHGASTSHSSSTSSSFVIASAPR